MNIINWVLSLNLFMSMATFTKEECDIYIDGKLDKSIGVYKDDSDRYVILFDKYFPNFPTEDFVGCFYINLKWEEKEVYSLQIKKVELKDEGKTLKINNSSFSAENLNVLQVVSGHVIITDGEIRFTPLLDREKLTGIPLIQELHKKEILIRKKTGKPQ